MRQTAQTRLDQDPVAVSSMKFSSSVGFKNTHHRNRSNNNLRVMKSPDQRSTNYSRWTKGSELASRAHSPIDDYYRTNSEVNNCRNIIKILFRNCDELSKKFEDT